MDFVNFDQCVLVDHGIALNISLGKSVIICTCFNMVANVQSFFELSILFLGYFLFYGHFSEVFSLLGC